MNVNNFPKMHWIVFLLCYNLFIIKQLQKEFMMIEINNVVKSFHHKEVLNIEQLTIHKGETVAVMGNPL